MIKAILTTIFYEICLFIEYYFVNGSRYISRLFFDSITAIEQKYGVRLNIKKIFDPLYQDYNPLMYVYSIPFRLLLIFIGSLSLFFTGVFYFILWIFWISLPFLISFAIYYGKNIF